MSKLSVTMAEAIRNGALRDYNIELHPGSYDVLLAMLAECDEELIYSKGATHLVALTGFSRTKIFGCLSALERFEIIHRAKRKLSGVEYKIKRSGLGV